MNLADVSWHPLLSSTNAPNGLSPKPGLIYRAFTRICPIPVSIFVERVLPRELLTVRLFPVPGLEERVTYEIKSTVMGTQISYSVTLRGWLSPLAWSLLKPYAARVASALANAAEQTSTLGKRKPSSQPW
nr:SRPBCC family protein [Pseudanabaena sp. FACHB-2040]